MTETPQRRGHASIVSAISVYFDLNTDEFCKSIYILL
jgi:hypothetical protein